MNVRKHDLHVDEVQVVERGTQKVSPQRARGVLLMTVAAASFSIMALLTRKLSVVMPSSECLWIRCVVNSAILMLLMIRGRVSLLGKHRRELSFRGAIGTVAAVAYFYTISYAPLAEGIALYRSSALYVPIFAFLIVRERITAYRMVLTVVGFIGCLLILKPSVANVSTALWVAVFGAISNAIAWTSVRSLTNKEHYMTVILYFCVCASIVVPILFGHSFSIPPTTYWPTALAMAIFGLVGQIFLTLAYRYAEASLITPIGYLELVFMALAGLFVFGESPDLFSCLGIGSILISGILIARSRSAAAT